MTQHGLSPRGRGNPSRSQAEAKVTRSIPAWAGEPILEGVQFINQEVYPRVGGGTWAEHMTRTDPEGLSPRGRGNLAGGPG